MLSLAFQQMGLHNPIGLNWLAISDLMEDWWLFLLTAGFLSPKKL